MATPIVTPIIKDAATTAPKISYAQLYSHQKTKSTDGNSAANRRQSQIDPPAELESRLRLIKALARQTKQRQREMEEKRRRLEREEVDARDAKLRARHEQLLKLDPLHRISGTNAVRSSFAYQRQNVCWRNSFGRPDKLPPLQRSEIVHSCPPPISYQCTAPLKTLEDCLSLPPCENQKIQESQAVKKEITINPLKLQARLDLATLNDEFDRTNRVQDILNRADAILNGAQNNCSASLYQNRGAIKESSMRPEETLEQFAVVEQICHSRPDLSAHEIVSILTTTADATSDTGLSCVKTDSVEMSSEERQLEESIRRLDYRLAQLFREIDCEAGKIYVE